MTTAIHPTAIIDPAARLGADVAIGPFCTVGPDVTLGDGVELISHAVVAGRTTIGDGTRIFPFASIGHEPQDKKYRGEPSELRIGCRNVIREHVTMNPGTEGGGMLTSVGDDGLFMVGAHVAHDCHVGNRVILANNATLAGHITVEDHAILGGMCAIQQFVRIGESAMIGGMTGVEQDVIPFGLVAGERGSLMGLNLIGLKRRGFDRDAINALRAVFRDLFLDGGQQFADRVARVMQSHDLSVPAVRQVFDFITADSDRKILMARTDASGSEKPAAGAA